MNRKANRMRTVLALLLCLCAGTHGESYQPANGDQARRQAISLFLECAFHPEYGAETGRLNRWEEEIRVWAGGGPTREDLAALDRFLAEAPARAEGLPPLRRVRQDSQANIRIWFIPEYMMPYYLEDYVDGNKGFFRYETRKDRIVSARIGIAADTTEQEERDHLILEELVGALGLPGDHLKYRDSILYDGWTVTRELSEVDWQMLEILYSGELRAGMTEKEASDLLWGR